nr:hypothetical protein BaRGS_029947 [Batillaria attramentaria]
MFTELQRYAVANDFHEMLDMLSKTCDVMQLSALKKIRQNSKQSRISDLFYVIARVCAGVRRKMIESSQKSAAQKIPLFLEGADDQQDSSSSEDALCVDESAGNEEHVHIDKSVDKTIEEHAIKNNLTANNVKSILRSLITHELVQTMLRNSLASMSEDQDETVFEPKLTRSKMKQVLQKGNDTNLWPVSPAKLGRPSATGPSILDVDFTDEEDEEDDEYQPDKDAEDLESDEESVTSSQVSDIGSPAPSTPQTPRTPVRSSSSMASTPVNKSNESLASPMGPPLPPGNRPVSKLAQQFKSSMKALEDSQNEQDVIAGRTRSKLPLTATSLYDIEEAFVAPDITPDMYDTFCDDTDWQDFLKGLQKCSGSDVQNESVEIGDDEQNDPEFNYLAEAETEELDKEDFRFDKPFRIPRVKLSEVQMREIWHSPVFMYPALLPTTGLLPRSVPQSVHFTLSEDRLIAIGLDQFTKTGREQEMATEQLQLLKEKSTEKRGKGRKRQKEQNSASSSSCSEDDASGENSDVPMETLETLRMKLKPRVKRHKIIMKKRQSRMNSALASTAVKPSMSSSGIVSSPAVDNLQDEEIFGTKMTTATQKHVLEKTSTKYSPAKRPIAPKPGPVNCSPQIDIEKRRSQRRITNVSRPVTRGLTSSLTSQIISLKVPWTRRGAHLAGKKRKPRVVEKKPAEVKTVPEPEVEDPGQDESDETASEVDEGAMLSQEDSQTEEDADGGDEEEGYVSELMAASTTIGFNPHKKFTPDKDDHRSKAEIRREQKLAVLAPDVVDIDPRKDERDTAYAQAYVNKVKLAMQKDPDTYARFMELLCQFEKQDTSPVQVYKDVCQLLHGYPDLLDDFASFLSPGQALRSGCNRAHQEAEKARILLRKLELHFEKSQPQYQRVLRLLARWDNKTTDPATLHRSLLPLLRSVPVYLLDEIRKFFPQERPPESNLVDFEDVALGDSDGDDNMASPDEFEEIELAEENDPYTTDACIFNLDEDEDDDEDDDDEEEEMEDDECGEKTGMEADSESDIKEEEEETVREDYPESEEEMHE